MLRRSRTTSSAQVLLRFRDRVRQVVEELCAAGAIHHAMIAGKRERHYAADDGLAVDRNDAIGNCADRQDCRLWGRNNRGEGLNLKHAQVADCECGASEILWARFPGFGAFGEVAALRRDFSDACDLRIRNHRRDYSIVHGDRDGDVHCGVKLDSIRRPTRVHARVLRQDASDERSEQIRMRDPDAGGCGYGSGQFFARLMERAGVHFANKEEMRDGGPTLRGALRH